MVRVLRRVCSNDDFMAEQVYIPNNLSSGGKVVQALAGQLPLCCWAVVILAPDFNSERWGTFKKSHTADVTNIPRGIRAKGVAVRQAYDEANVVRKSVT